MIQKNLLLQACIVMALLLPVGALSTDDSVVINMMIDAELYPYAVNMTPEDRIDIEVNSILDMLNEIDPKGLNVTVYTNSEFVSERVGNASYKMYVTFVGSKPNHELAITTDEMIEFMPYGEQYPHFREMKRLIEAAYICEGKPVEVEGFRPQHFDQGDTTYRILDKMKFVYDSGYKAGLRYQPGHENDTWPYLVENHNFYAVPVSTHQLEGVQVYLSDRYAIEDLGLSGTQWYDLLISEFEECVNDEDPMVIILTNFVSGWDEEYMEAFKDFIDYATFEGATFVTTLELVDIVKPDEETAEA